MMSNAAQTYDPRNLIRESYRMDGLGPAECRSIFLDWLLGLKDGQTAAEAASALLDHYADAPPDHPMTRILREARGQPSPTRRRAGGAMGRRNRGDPGS